MARLTLATLGAALLLARGAAATTCAEKQAAGEACIVPYTFPADTQMCGYTLPSYWDGPAPVCYTQYGHNQLATPTFMPSNSSCSAYTNRGCCSSEIVQGIDNDAYGTTGDYPGYSSRCGPLSDACLAFFRMEACFYECDHNIGKYRKYPTCVDALGEQNAWEIAAMPLSSTQADAWFNACQNDLFCTGASGSYFDLPSVQCEKPVAPNITTDTCRRFGDIYGNASNMITAMWSGSFAYGGPNDYTFPQPGAAPFDGSSNINPNNLVAAASGIANPPFCPFRPSVDGQTQATSDIQLYITNMLKYANAVYAGSLYTLSATPLIAWFSPSASAADMPAATPGCPASGAAALRVTGALALAAVAALLV